MKKEKTKSPRKKVTILESRLLYRLSFGADASGFRARSKMPLVLGELFKPVSDTSSASSNPIF
jgi:hypothetical protein